MKLEIQENTRSLCLGPKNFVFLRREEMILVASYRTSRVCESCVIQKSSWNVYRLRVSGYGRRHCFAVCCLPPLAPEVSGVV
jgi:hypothetical protein